MTKEFLSPNEFIKTLKPYKPIARKVFEQDFENILKIDWNESTLPPSPAVKRAILNALDSEKLDSGKLDFENLDSGKQDFQNLQISEFKTSESKNHAPNASKFSEFKTHLERYPDTHNAALYAKLAQYVGVSESEIEIFSGSDMAHECIVNVFLNAGDTLLIFSPSYDNFRSFAQARGANVVFYDYFAQVDSQKQDSENSDSQNLQISESKICEQIKSTNPKMVYICNPNNPTGAVIQPQILQNIIAKFPHIAFVIDEAYFEFYGQSLASEIANFGNLIITRTFSKAFGLASLRIGYCVSAAPNIENLNKLRNPKSINALAQIGALAALSDIKYMQNFVLEVQESREHFCDVLRKLGLHFYTSSANFVLLVSGLDLAKELEKKGIFIRDYRHILPNHFRASIGTREQTNRVISAFKELYGGGAKLKSKSPRKIALRAPCVSKIFAGGALCCVA